MKLTAVASLIALCILIAQAPELAQAARSSFARGLLQTNSSTAPVASAAPTAEAHSHSDGESHAGEEADDLALYGTRQFLLSISSNLTAHRGLWNGIGDAQPEEPYAAYDTGKLPDCSKHVNHFNYDHFSEDDIHFTFISGDSETQELTTAGHKRTTQYRVLSYNNSVLRLVDLNTGNNVCRHWQPVLNLETGDLQVYSMSMNLWTHDGVNASAPANRTSLTCEAAGDEVPGCYGPGQDVVRSSNVPEAITLIGQERAASGNFSARPEGSVISVAMSSYVCQNGECALASRRLAEADHDH